MSGFLLGPGVVFLSLKMMTDEVLVSNFMLKDYVFLGTIERMVGKTSCFERLDNVYILIYVQLSWVFVNGMGMRRDTVKWIYTVQNFVRSVVMRCTLLTSIDTKVINHEN